MKCLTLRRPLADLVVDGSKTIELRTWFTNFRGEFLVHASKKIDLKACDALGIDPSKLVTGAIVGKARLVGVKDYGSMAEVVADADRHLVAGVPQYLKARYGFLLSDAQKFRAPIPLKGRQNFFEVPASVIEDAKAVPKTLNLLRGERDTKRRDRGLA